MIVLTIILGVIFPRLTLIFIGLLTNWFNVYQTFIWPFLGFFLFPYTTLCYMGAMHLFNGNFNFDAMLIVFIGLVADCIDWGYEINKH